MRSELHMEQPLSFPDVDPLGHRWRNEANGANPEWDLAFQLDVFDEKGGKLIATCPIAQKQVVFTNGSIPATSLLLITNGLNGVLIAGRSYWFVLTVTHEAKGLWALRELSCTGLSAATACDSGRSGSLPRDAGPVGLRDKEAGRLEGRLRC